MAAPQPRLLIGVDLAGGRHPTNPGRWVVVEEDGTVHGYPVGQLERCAIKDEQIDARRDNAGGASPAPPRGDVDIGVGQVGAGNSAAVQQREPGTGGTQRVYHPDA